MTNNKPKPFTYKFVNDGSNLLLELTNATRQVLKRVEILTVFLKNDDALGWGPSQVHIRFEGVARILPAENSITQSGSMESRLPLNPTICISFR